MSDTVLDIGHKLSDDVGIPRYNNLIGNTDQNARKILTSIKDGLDNDVFVDRDWETLQIEGAITLLGGGVAEYALPVDYNRIVNDTIWDDTNSRPVRGPIDVREWQEFNKGFAQLAGLELVCRIQRSTTSTNKVMTFYPDTSAADISFWYISDKPVVSSSGTAQTEILKDDDEFIVPAKAVRAAAKWRLLRSLGMSFDDERIEYASVLDDLASNDSGGKKIITTRSRRYDIANTPSSGYGS